jgi:hypothetical protein
MVEVTWRLMASSSLGTLTASLKHLGYTLGATSLLGDPSAMNFLEEGPKIQVAK